MALGPGRDALLEASKAAGESDKAHKGQDDEDHDPTPIRVLGTCRYMAYIHTELFACILDMWKYTFVCTFGLGCHLLLWAVLGMDDAPEAAPGP